MYRFLNIKCLYKNFYNKCVRPGCGGLHGRGLYDTLKSPAHAEQCSEVSTKPHIQLIRGLALAALRRHPQSKRTVWNQWGNQLGCYYQRSANLSKELDRVEQYVLALLWHEAIALLTLQIECWMISINIPNVLFPLNIAGVPEVSPTYYPDNRPCCKDQVAM